MIPYKQLSVNEVFEICAEFAQICAEKLENSKPASCASEKASMTIFDTSGIKAFVTENNPQYANRIIKQLKAFKKAKKLGDSYDPYKAAYSAMQSHAAANPAIQQMYINGHFCYSFKFGIVTNGLRKSVYPTEKQARTSRRGLPFKRKRCSLLPTRPEFTNET